MTLAFEMRGVCKRYEHFALENLDLRLPEGEVMGLVGVNGAGKTTVLRLLSGLAAADAGEVQVLGLSLPAAQVAVKQQLGLASEDMRLYGKQNLRWHMDLVSRIYPAWDETYALHLLRRFDLRPEQRLSGYSHGQRVKALLLLVLARRPRLLLLDEPTTGLDPLARTELLEALAEVLLDEGRSVLFSSHNAHDIERLADSIAFLHAGRLLSLQDKESFLSSWRRVVGQGELPADVQAWPELALLRRNGQLAELKLRSYSEALSERLRSQGFQIHKVEAMSLEDIFISTVRAGEPA
jgi:ABC-2 type transport system ATP-binding protein